MQKYTITYKQVVDEKTLYEKTFESNDEGIWEAINNIFFSVAEADKKVSTFDLDWVQNENPEIDDLFVVRENCIELQDGSEHYVKMTTNF